VTPPGGVSLPVVTLFLLTFALALPTADNSQTPGPRIPMVQDWSHRHLVFGGGGSLEARIAAAKNPRAVGTVLKLRCSLRGTWKPHLLRRSSHPFASPSECRINLAGRRAINRRAIQ